MQTRLAAKIGVLLSITLANAALAEASRGFRSALFDGKDLHHWTITGCEVAIEDQAMVLRAGDGLVRTNSKYDDFVLELDWRALREEGWDSGIYIRADAPPAGRPWPKRYQINLLDGQEGNLLGVPGAKSVGLIHRGQWNHFKLTVVADTAELEINGKPAWKAKGLENPAGYIGLQSEVGGGGQFEFKDIFVTELKHASLFNGNEITAWEGAGSDASKCWKAEDGLLVCTGEKGPWLRSVEQYDDFDLRLEYKLKPGGNSGVYIRVPESGNHHGKDAGIEVQILDDAAERYAKLKPYQYCGSLYAITAADPRVSRAAGVWNSLEIRCQGTHYTVTHNGTVVIDANAREHPELKQRLVKGHLGLQNHKEHVWFRNLRINTSP